MAFARPGRAEETPQVRVPVSLQLGWDSPLGTGGLSLAVENPHGWGLGVGVGFKDAVPGDWHTLVAVNLRAPMVRRGRFDLAGVVFGSWGDRELQREDQVIFKLLRWEWRPAFRAGVGLSARLRSGAYAVRLEAGAAYAINEPDCQYVNPNIGVFVDPGPCTNPMIPASEDATNPWLRFAPFVALAGEYDVAAPWASTAPDAAVHDGSDASAGAAVEPREPPADGRASNGWAMPTALTLPARTVRATLYEGFVPEVSVGVTDWLQGDAAFSYLSTSSLWRFQARVALRRTGRVRVTALATTVGWSAEWGSGVSVWAGGAVGSVCLDGACRSLASLTTVAGQSWLTYENSAGQTDFSLLLSPNLVVALGPRAKLVLELYFGGAQYTSDVKLRGNTAGVLMVRLPFTHLGLELGIASNGYTTLPAGSVSWTF